ncbi:MAG: hypothetical protein ACOCSM_03335, partial [Bacillota bacterium]
INEVIFMYAIIDLGSNTVRMNVYQIKRGKLTLKDSYKETIGLAAYLEHDTLSKRGLQIALETVTGFLSKLKYSDVNKIYLIATATIRKAKNNRAFLKALKPYKKLDIHLLTGRQEALYDYHAITRGAMENKGVVVDIGGGSTEIVTFEKDTVLSAFAMPIGSLSSYMQDVDKLIPTEKAASRIRSKVFQHLSDEDITRPEGALTIHGIGGTIRATRKLIQANSHVDLDSVIPSDRIQPMIDTIHRKNKESYLTLIRTVPERIHTIGTGMIILKAIIDYFDAPAVRIYDQGIREGFIMKHLEEDYPELRPLKLKM